MTDTIDIPAAWHAADMTDPKEWAIQLSETQITTLKEALSTVKRKALNISELDRENFPLPGFAPLIDETKDRLENGRGVVVLRGFPALDFDKEDLRLLFWGLGLHLGTAVTQSSKGDLLGDVRDFGDDVMSTAGRGYMSRQKLGFHADTCDVVALMVLRTAQRGGLSYIVSSVAIRNEIAKRHPDKLHLLYEPYYFSWKGQEAPGSLPYYEQPIYTEHNGKFASRYVRTHVLSAHKDFNHVIGDLSKQKLEALELVSEIANDPKFHFSMMFEPGDIQLLNNHVIYHSRSAYEDFDEEDRKRHLLRMWLSMDNTRELGPGMAAIYQDRRAGVVRGGFPSRTGSVTYKTEKSID